MRSITRIALPALLFLLSVPTLAYDTLPQCKDEFRIVRGDKVRPVEESSRVCDCAFKRATDTVPSNTDLLQCMHKLRIDNGGKVWGDEV